MLSKLTELFSKKNKTLNDGFKTFKFKNAFSVEAPSDWLQNDSEFLSVSSPNDEINISISCYHKPDGDLKSFSNYRFQAVHECYEKIGIEEQIDKNIVCQAYEGTWPNESKPTFYKVACIQIGQSFGSIGFTTQIKENLDDLDLYKKIVTSLKINS